MDKTTMRLMATALPPRPTNIQFVAGTQNATAAGTGTTVLTTPSGVQAGDLLVICVGYSGSGPITQESTGTFSLRVNIDTPLAGAGVSKMCVLTKTATASEPSTYTLTQLGGYNYQAEAICAVFRGANWDAAATTAASGSQGTNSTAVVPSATASLDHSVAVVFAYAMAAATNITSATMGAAKISRLSAAPGACALFSKEVQAGPTATETVTIAGSGNLKTGGIQMILKEA